MWINRRDKLFTKRLIIHTRQISTTKKLDASLDLILGYLKILVYLHVNAWETKQYVKKN